MNDRITTRRNTRIRFFLIIWNCLDWFTFAFCIVKCIRIGMEKLRTSAFNSTINGLKILIFTWIRWESSKFHSMGIPLSGESTKNICLISDLVKLCWTFLIRGFWTYLIGWTLENCRLNANTLQYSFIQDFFDICNFTLNTFPSADSRFPPLKDNNISIIAVVVEPVFVDRIVSHWMSLKSKQIHLKPLSYSLHKSHHIICPFHCDFKKFNSLSDSDVAVSLPCAPFCALHIGAERTHGSNLSNDVAASVGFSISLVCFLCVFYFFLLLREEQVSYLYSDGDKVDDTSPHANFLSFVKASK